MNVTMKPNGEAWVEGFMEHCAAAGVPMEQVPALMKVAAQHQLMQNVDFREGVETQLKAAGINKEALPFLIPALAGLGGLGLGALGQRKPGEMSWWQRLRSRFSPDYKQRLLSQNYDQLTGAANTAKSDYLTATQGVADTRKRMEGTTGTPGTSYDDRGRFNPWLY